MKNIEEKKIGETTGKILFCRHGETPNNAEKRMNTGDDNNPLNDTGREQAKQAGIELEETSIQIDQIISSNLDRTKETAKIIAEQIDYIGDILQDSRLREQDGGLFKGRRRETLGKLLGTTNDISLRKIFKNKKYNKAEGIKEFDTRVTQALTDIRENYKNKTILIVGHSGTSRPLLREIQGLNFKFAHYKMDGLPNAKIIDLEDYFIENKKLKA